MQIGIYSRKLGSSPSLMLKDNADRLDETLHANLKVCIPEVFLYAIFFLSLSLSLDKHTELSGRALVLV